jgi:BASS family bile acid:Na+ symporter
VDEIIPLWLVNVLAFTTVFSVMTAIGTTVRPGTFLEHIVSPSLLGRGLFNVLVLVPIVGILSSFVVGLSLPEKVGITLIVIAPGAPLALRRALGSGEHAGFAPALQVAVAILALPALPLWVAIGNWILGTHGIVDLAAVAKQVSLAQLLPLALGAAVRGVAPVWGPRLGIALGRAGAALLIIAIATEVINLHAIIALARPGAVVVATITTLVAIVMGHLFGGVVTAVRHSIAVASALRNVGLALLIAETNKVPPVVQATIITYAMSTLVLVTIYIFVYTRWLKRGAREIASC